MIMILILAASSLHHSIETLHESEEYLADIIYFRPRPNLDSDIDNNIYPFKNLEPSEKPANHFAARLTEQGSHVPS